MKGPPPMKKQEILVPEGIATEYYKIKATADFAVQLYNAVIDLFGFKNNK